MTKCYITLGGSDANETALARDRLAEVFNKLGSPLSEPATPPSSITDKVAAEGWRHLRTLEADLPVRPTPFMVAFCAAREAKLDATIMPDVGRIVETLGQHDALYLLLNSKP